MLSILIIFFVIQLFVSLVLWYGNRLSKQAQNNSANQKTTVIIPYKNEFDRISPLLNSINQTAILHKKTNLFSNFEFIFVDDHSNDKTYNLIIDKLDIKFKIVKLKNTKGKKYAIKRGVELSKFNRILTLDADVSFNTQYLQAILKTPCLNLTVLPVNMKGNDFLSNLFSVEFWFLQRLTFGLAGFNVFSLCNGANLLFTKQAFTQALTIRQDANIKSGDDIFLLKALQKLKRPINSHYNVRVSVETYAPKNFTNLVIQRLRWLSKVNDFTSVLGGLYILIVNALFCLALILLAQGNLMMIIPILIKLLAEIISVNDFKKIFWVVLHQFFYPFYLIGLLFLRPFSNLLKWRDFS